MCGLHEVSTQHGEGNAVAVLGRELHALLELVLKDGRVEADNNNKPMIAGNDKTFGNKRMQNDASGHIKGTLCYINKW